MLLAFVAMLLGCGVGWVDAEGLVCCGQDSGRQGASAGFMGALTRVTRQHKNLLDSSCPPACARLPAAPVGFVCLLAVSTCVLRPACTGVQGGGQKVNRQGAGRPAAPRGPRRAPRGARGAGSLLP